MAELDDNAKMFVNGWKILIAFIILLALSNTYEGRIATYYYNLHFSNDSFTCNLTGDYTNTANRSNEFIKCKQGYKIIEFPVYNEDLYYKATDGKQVIKVKGSTDILLVKNNNDTLIFNCSR